MRFFIFLTACLLLPALRAETNPPQDFRVLATNKTSTMQKEMNEAADQGFALVSVMGGETSFGGNEVVIVMGRPLSGDTKATKSYLLLATNKTSTMQKEMRRAAEEGYEYKGQSVFHSTFGGREVAVIMERDLENKQARHEFLLLATSKTSTMQKELLEAGTQGFALMGMTVAETSFGGNELVCIMRKILE